MNILKPLKVICINSKNSIKLIKGGIYSAESLYSRVGGEKTIYLRNIGDYNIKYFTSIDGDSLNNIPDFNLNSKRVDPDKNNYTGQFVMSGYSNGKSIKEGEIYYVEEHKKLIENRANFRGVVTQSNVDKFKLRGIKTPIRSYNFIEIDSKEQRYIKLKNLKGENTKTADQTRKFLLYSEKERTIILFETLTKALIDLKHVELDKPANIVEMMLIKGKNYVINEDDIKSFLNEKIITSIKKF